jgi:hypothetical protein
MHHDLLIIGKARLGQARPLLFEQAREDIAIVFAACVFQVG